MKNDLIYKIIIGVFVLIVGFLVIRTPDIHSVVTTSQKGFVREDFDGETWLRMWGSWDTTRYGFVGALEDVSIECGRIKRVCTEIYSVIDRVPDEGGLYNVRTGRDDYEVVSWTDDVVRAVRKRPEVTHELSINLTTEDVILVERSNVSLDGEFAVVTYMLK